MFYLFAALMTPSFKNKQYAYFWDYVSALQIQCVLDNTVWINGRQIDGPQKLGNYLEVMSVDLDHIKMKINDKIVCLKIGRTVKIPRKTKALS